jgi:hypothetical protein
MISVVMRSGAALAVVAAPGCVESADSEVAIDPNRLTSLTYLPISA